MPADALRTVLRVVAGVGLALTILPAIAYFLRWMDKPAMIVAMVIGMLLWYAAAIVLQRQTPAAVDGI